MQKPLQHEQYPFPPNFEDAAMDAVAARDSLRTLRDFLIPLPKMTQSLIWTYKMNGSLFGLELNFYSYHDLSICSLVS
jgi:hypothetical protein